jgi:hypothetical protein
MKKQKDRIRSLFECQNKFRAEIHSNAGAIIKKW